jgi:hypothetical protein
MLSHTGKGEAYGWLKGAILLNKTAAAAGLMGASWRVAALPTLSINSTAEGTYTVVDTEAGTSTPAATLKAARAIAAITLAACPAAVAHAKAITTPPPPEGGEVPAVEPPAVVEPPVEAAPVVEPEAPKKPVKAAKPKGAILKAGSKK